MPLYIYHLLGHAYNYETKAVIVVCIAASEDLTCAFVMLHFTIVV